MFGAKELSVDVDSVVEQADAEQFYEVEGILSYIESCEYEYHYKV